LHGLNQKPGVVPSLHFLYAGRHNLYDAFTGVFLGFPRLATRERVMDLFYLALIAGFFILTVGLVYGCDRLRGKS
jgi:hypothetical protein